VIEGGWQPTRGCVAGGTIGAITAIMLVVGGMTAITIGRCPLIDTIDMTTGTGNAYVFSGQFKRG